MVQFHQRLGLRQVACGVIGILGFLGGCSETKTGNVDIASEMDSESESESATTNNADTETTDESDTTDDTGPADCGLPSTVMPMVEVPTLASSDAGVTILDAYSNHGEAALFIAAENPLDPEAVHSVQRWSAGEVAWEVELPREGFAVAIDEASGNTVIAGGSPIGLQVRDFDGELVQEAALVGLEGVVHAAVVAGGTLFLAGQDQSQVWAARVTDASVDWITPALDPPVNGQVGLAVSDNIALVAYHGQGIALHVEDGSPAWPLDQVTGIMTARPGGGFLVTIGHPAEVVAINSDGTQAWTSAVSTATSSEATSIQVHGDAAWLSVIPSFPENGWSAVPTDLGAVRLDGSACAAVSIFEAYAESPTPRVMIVGEDDSVVLIGNACPENGLWCGVFSARVI